MKRLAIVLTAVFLVTVLSYAGVYYKLKVTTEIMDAKVKKQMESSPYGDTTAPMVIETYAKSQGEFRSKILEGSNLFIPKGSVILSNDGKLMYVLNPEKKTYWKIDINHFKTMGETAMKMMKNFAKMRYTDVYVGVTPLGEGEKIAGFKTKKYKTVVKYTVLMKILFKKVKTEVKEESDIYATEQFKLEDFDMYTFQNMFSTGVPEVDAQISSKLKGIGFPLKKVSYEYSKDKLQSITTLEVLEIKKTSVNSSMFKVPENYTEEPSPFEQAMGNPTADSEEGEGDNPNNGKKKFNFKELFQ